MASLRQTDVRTMELEGDQTVASAGQLFDRLPHGWTLLRFEYDAHRGYWVAKVRGPLQEVRL
jgi:hypothetical protein